LVHTFKTSVFTWFQLGGVESLQEFAMSREALDEWLTNLQQDEEEDADVRHNALVLQEFLLKCILPRKKRFLVCLRNGSMTLDYRANSALEGPLLFHRVTLHCHPPYSILLRHMTVTCHVT